MTRVLMSFEHGYKWYYVYLGRHALAHLGYNKSYGSTNGSSSAAIFHRLVRCMAGAYALSFMLNILKHVWNNSKVNNT